MIFLVFILFFYLFIFTFVQVSMVHFIAFSVMIILVQSASLTIDRCENPTDLEQRYKDLKGQNKLPLTLKNTTTKKQNKTCPVNKSNRLNFCPSIRKIIADETIFPSIRTDIICLCRDCRDSYQLKDCTRIYEEKLVLNRTGNCLEGVYEYVPHILITPVACQCKPKIIYDSNSYQYDL